MSLDADPSFWKQVVAGIATTAGGLFGYHKYMENKIANKADAKEVMEIKGEIGRIRDVQAKVFDQMRENEQRAQDRFEKILEKL